jgi:hypothetical protein
MKVTREYLKNLDIHCQFNVGTQFARVVESLIDQQGQE